MPLECTKPNVSSTYHMGKKISVWSFAFSGDDLIWAINTKSTVNPNIPASQRQVAFPSECSPPLLPQQESTAWKVHGSNSKEKKNRIIHFIGLANSEEEKSRFYLSKKRTELENKKVTRGWGTPHKKSTQIF